MTKVCAAQLARQAARKRAYRAGLRSFRLAADPVDLIELLGEAGVVVGVNPDARAVGDGLTRLVEMWNSGRIGLLVRDADGEDDAGAA
jgi:hypothetical protein